MGGEPDRGKDAGRNEVNGLGIHHEPHHTSPEDHRNHQEDTPQGVLVQDGEIAQARHQGGGELEVGGADQQQRERHAHPLRHQVHLHEELQAGSRREERVGQPHVHQEVEGVPQHAGGAHEVRVGPRTQRPALRQAHRHAAAQRVLVLPHEVPPVHVHVIRMPRGELHGCDALVRELELEHHREALHVNREVPALEALHEPGSKELDRGHSSLLKNAKGMPKA